MFPFMKKIVLTIGCPGSGKSHAAEEFVSIYEKNGFKVIRINADDIRHEFTGKQDDFTKDRAVWAELFARFENALVDKSVDVISVSNTSINLKSRKPYYDIINKFDMAVEMKYLIFPPDVDACMELQKDRERKVPREIVENFAARFAAPDTLTDWARVSGVHENFVYSTAYAVRCAKGLEK